MAAYVDRLQELRSLRNIVRAEKHDLTFFLQEEVEEDEKEFEEDVVLMEVRLFACCY